MEQNVTENEITCPSGKRYFRTKTDINNYITIRNKRCGGDGYKSYYCILCGGYHLTTNTVYGEKLIMKPYKKYSRLQKKDGDFHILKSTGLA